jgi:hypothetical protein
MLWHASVHEFDQPNANLVLYFLLVINNNNLIIACVFMYTLRESLHQIGHTQVRMDQAETPSTMILSHRKEASCATCGISAGAQHASVKAQPRSHGLRPTKTSCTAASHSGAALPSRPAAWWHLCRRRHQRILAEGNCTCEKKLGIFYPRIFFRFGLSCFC